MVSVIHDRYSRVLQHAEGLQDQKTERRVVVEVGWRVREETTQDPREDASISDGGRWIRPRDLNRTAHDSRTPASSSLVSIPPSAYSVQRAEWGYIQLHYLNCTVYDITTYSTHWHAPRRRDLPLLLNYCRSPDPTPTRDSKLYRTCTDPIQNASTNISAQLHGGQSEVRTLQGRAPRVPPHPLMAPSLSLSIITITIAIAITITITVAAMPLLTLTAPAGRVPALSRCQCIQYQIETETATAQGVFF